MPRIFKSSWAPSFLTAAFALAGLALVFQNCTGSFQTEDPNFSGLAPLASEAPPLTGGLFATQNPAQDPTFPQSMNNTLEKKSDGTANPFYGQSIRNILVYQGAGWSGLPTETARNGWKVDAPLFGGASAYLSKNAAFYEKQMRMIAALGPHMAIAMLLMDQGDSDASGYGACWNGTWITDRQCQGGQFLFPQGLFDAVKAAAKKSGLQVIPDFSVMNWEKPGQYDGARFLPKLKALLQWVRPRLDDGNVKTLDGKWVIIIDSLPETAGLSPQQKQEVHQWMTGQSDIFWLDNAVSPIDGPKVPTTNIFGAGWGTLAAQNAGRANWSGHFQNWVGIVKEASRDYALALDPAFQYSESDLLNEMNVSPFNIQKYPVVISQWNEYAENLYFEPGAKIGMTNYNRLKGWIARQGPDPLPFIAAQPADFTDDPGPLVQALYQKYLFRGPDAEGLKSYVSELNSGASVGSVEREIASSYEAKFVVFYKTYLQRLPTMSEIVKNNGDLASGRLTLAQLEQNLRQSPECKVSCLAPSPTPTVTATPQPTATPDLAARVKALYQKYLFRDPDADGSQYYTAKLKSGASLASVENEIASSYEAKFVGFYKTYLQRLPTMSEILKNNGDLSSGRLTLAQLEQNLRSSSDCKASCLKPTPTPKRTVTVAPAPDPTAQVKVLYQKYLFRDPDADGLRYYVDRLKSGVSLASVEHEIASSNEAKVIGVYQKYLFRLPDSDGLKFYVSKLNSGTSLSAVENEIAASYEAKFVVYYKTYLQRLPTLAEIVKNNGDLSGGKLTLAQLEQNLRKSAACKTQCL